LNDLNHFSRAFQHFDPKISPSIKKGDFPEHIHGTANKTKIAISINSETENKRFQRKKDKTRKSRAKPKKTEPNRKNRNFIKATGKPKNIGLKL
jgi:hypothetical protein